MKDETFSKEEMMDWTEMLSGDLTEHPLNDSKRKIAVTNLAIYLDRRKRIYVAKWDELPEGIEVDPEDIKKEFVSLGLNLNDVVTLDFVIALERVVVEKYARKHFFKND